MTGWTWSIFCGCLGNNFLRPTLMPSFIPSLYFLFCDHSFFRSFQNQIFSLFLLSQCLPHITMHWCHHSFLLYLFSMFSDNLFFLSKTKSVLVFVFLSLFLALIALMPSFMHPVFIFSGSCNQLLLLNMIATASCVPQSSSSSHLINFFYWIWNCRSTMCSPSRSRDTSVRGGSKKRREQAHNAR